MYSASISHCNEGERLKKCLRSPGGPQIPPEREGGRERVRDREREEERGNLIVLEAWLTFSNPLFSFSDTIKRQNASITGFFWRCRVILPTTSVTSSLNFSSLIYFLFIINKILRNDGYTLHTASQKNNSVEKTCFINLHFINNSDWILFRDSFRSDIQCRLDLIRFRVI